MFLLMSVLCRGELEGGGGGGGGAEGGEGVVGDGGMECLTYFSIFLTQDR